MNVTHAQLKAIFEKLGYTFYEGDMNLNMIGVRTKNRAADNYDDFFILAFERDGLPVVKIYEGFTTDPGIYYLKNKLLNPNGCAILKPGQYRGMWKIGLHGYNNPYTAFVQKRGCTVYRDRNKDSVTDFNPESEDTGIFGINQHHGYGSKNVGPNSAGCQVHRDSAQLKEIIDVAKQSMNHYPNSFTYTLLTEEDFV